MLRITGNPRYTGNAHRTATLVGLAVTATLLTVPLHATAATDATAAQAATAAPRTATVTKTAESTMGAAAEGAAAMTRSTTGGTDRSARHGDGPVALPNGFRPEGITSGPGDTYYVGSLADGRIRTGDLGRATGRDLLPGALGRALRGLYLDRRSDLLWAVGQETTNGVTVGLVLVVDRRSGAVEHRIEIPDAGFLNDIVVTRRAAWVTDSNVDRLTRITLDRRSGHPVGDPSHLPLTGEWPTPASGLHANGIRALEDDTLLLDHSSAGGLWQVDPATGTTTAVPIAGGPPVTAGDGVELKGRTVYVVRGTGRQEVSVLHLTPTSAGWTAEWAGALTSPDLDVPSTATLVGRTLWAVNARFGVPEPTTAPFAIVPLRTRS